MKRTVVSSQLSVVGCVLFLIAAWTRAGIEGEINAALQNKLLEKATVGVVVAQLDASAPAKVLYKRNPNVPLTPASNMKLITTSAAVDHFGADFKLRTLLVQRGPDVVLVGDGDPSFGDAEALRKSGWTPTTVFDNWAAGLTKAGMTEFRDVLVDDSIFDESFVHPRWDPKQLHNRYSAQIGGMTLNLGCVDFYVHPNGRGQIVQYTLVPATKYITVQNTCVGGGENAIVLDRKGEENAIVLKGSSPTKNEVPASITIHDPPMFAATVLSECLAKGGIKITGKVARDRTVRARATGEKLPEDMRLLAVHEASLLTIIARANKDSCNPYADSLSKRLGAAFAGQSGSWSNGAAAAGAFLKKCGADEKEFKLDDGCGLSRENAVSADAMVKLLDYNFRSKNREAFIGTLAVAGQDGTLEERFKGSDLRGRVFAKSGFINHVSALSGYLKGRDDKWYAFSILMNGIPMHSNSMAKQIQEAVVKAIEGPAAVAKKK